MRFIVFPLLLFFFVSCNREIYPSIRAKEISIKSDSFFMASPKYDYFELANSERHDSRNWVFSKDSATYFQIFDKELNLYLQKHPNIKVENTKNLSGEEVDKCFIILSNGNADSLHTYLKSLTKQSLVSSNRYAFLKVDFVINKESGTSGLGPMGNFTPMGEFDFYFFIIEGTKLIHYSSMKRFASFFNRGYSSSRGKKAVRAFFRRI